MIYCEMSADWLNCEKRPLWKLVINLFSDELRIDADSFIFGFKVFILIRQVTLLQS